MQSLTELQGTVLLSRSVLRADTSTLCCFSLYIHYYIITIFFRRAMVPEMAVACWRRSEPRRGEAGCSFHSLHFEARTLIGWKLNKVTAWPRRDVTSICVRSPGRRVSSSHTHRNARVAPPLQHLHTQHEHKNTVTHRETTPFLLSE